MDNHPPTPDRWRTHREARVENQFRNGPLKGQLRRQDLEEIQPGRQKLVPRLAYHRV